MEHVLSEEVVLHHQVNVSLIGQLDIEPRDACSQDVMLWFEEEVPRNLELIALLANAVVHLINFEVG